MLCSRRGIVPMYHHCRKFQYDPLRRVPFRQPEVGSFSEEEFRLD